MKTRLLVLALFALVALVLAAATMAKVKPLPGGIKDYRVPPGSSTLRM